MVEQGVYHVRAHTRRRLPIELSCDEAFCIHASGKLESILQPCVLAVGP